MRNVRVADTGRRDRWFESGSLQRGVRCEPDSSDQARRLCDWRDALFAHIERSCAPDIRCKACQGRVLSPLNRAEKAAASSATSKLTSINKSSPSSEYLNLDGSNRCSSSQMRIAAIRSAK